MSEGLIYLLAIYRKADRSTIDPADLRGRSYTPTQIALRAARNALGLSQPAFARLLQTPVGTVLDWEQGRFPPSGSALLVARLAVDHPEVLQPYVEASEAA